MKNILIEGDSEYIINRAKLSISNNDKYVDIDLDGKWKCIWPYDVPPGNHKVSVEGTDINGYLKRDEGYVNIIETDSILYDDTLEYIDENPNVEELTDQEINNNLENSAAENNTGINTYITMNPVEHPDLIRPAWTTNCTENLLTSNHKYYAINSKDAPDSSNWAVFLTLKLDKETLSKKEINKINNTDDNILSNELDNLRTNKNKMNIHDASTYASTNNIEYENCIPLKDAIDISSKEDISNDLKRINLNDKIYLIDLINNLVIDQDNLKYNNSKNCLIETKQLEVKDKELDNARSLILDHLGNDNNISTELNNIFNQMDEVVMNLEKTKIEDTNIKDNITKIQTKECSEDMEIESVVFVFEEYSKHSKIIDNQDGSFTLSIDYNESIDNIFLFIKLKSKASSNILLGNYIINQDIGSTREILFDYGLNNYIKSYFRIMNTKITDKIEYTIDLTILKDKAKSTLENLGLIDHNPLGSNSLDLQGTSNVQDRMYLKDGKLIKIEYSSMHNYEEGWPTHNFIYKDKTSYDIIIKPNEKLLIQGNINYKSSLDNNKNEFFMVPNQNLDTESIADDNIKKTIESVLEEIQKNKDNSIAMTLGLNDIFANSSDDVLELLKDPESNIIKKSMDKLEEIGLIEKYKQVSYLGDIVISLNEKEGIYLHIIDNKLMLTQPSTNKTLNLSKEALEVPMDFDKGNIFFIHLEKNNLIQKLTIMDEYKNIVSSQNLDFLGVPIFPHKIGYSSRFRKQLCFDLLTITMSGGGDNLANVWLNEWNNYISPSEFEWIPAPNLYDIPNNHQIENSINIHDAQWNINPWLNYMTDGYLTNFFCRFSPIQESFELTLWFKMDKIKGILDYTIKRDRRVLISDDVNGHNFYIDETTRSLHWDKLGYDIILFNNIEEGWTFFDLKFNYDKNQIIIKICNLKNEWETFEHIYEFFEFDLKTLGAQYSKQSQSYINFFKGSFTYINLFIKDLSSDERLKLYRNQSRILKGI